MLYISRFVGQSKYGVVDTDDGSETIITHRELWEICIDLGVDIKGVNIESAMSRNKVKRYIHGVEVYQHVSSLTKEQAKLKLLRGVDVKTFGDQIVSVSVDTDIAPRDVSIRLSDYGSVCGECIFKLLPYARSKIITVVLDERIAISGKSLKHFAERGVCIDMHEVKSQKIADYVCREIAQAQRSIGNMEQFVSDTPDRIDYYTAVAVLNRSGNSDPEITNIADIVSNPRNTNRIIAKKYFHEFDSVSKAKFAAIKNTRWATAAKSFAQWLANPLNAGLMTFHDYQSLRRSRFIDIFKVLRELSTTNKSVLRRFENYVKFFDATPNIQTSYIRLCESAGNWLLTYAKSVHWI